MIIIAQPSITMSQASKDNQTHSLVLKSEGVPDCYEGRGTWAALWAQEEWKPKRCSLQRMNGRVGIMVERTESSSFFVGVGGGAG